MWGGLDLGRVCATKAFVYGYLTLYDLNSCKNTSKGPRKIKLGSFICVPMYKCVYCAHMCEGSGLV